MTIDEKNLTDFNREVALIGGGKMGLALLMGWLDAGLRPALVHVVDPNPSAGLRTTSAQWELAVETTPRQLTSGVIVLAVKPQIIDAVADAVAPMMSDKCLVLSIMAGIKLDRLRTRFPAAKSIMRGMPNLAASVGCGATIVVSEETFEPNDRVDTERLLSVSGSVERLDDEDLMDAGTALSGSGPGYLFYVVECLAKAGERAGLPADIAARLARQTVVGAGALLARSPKSAIELREEVTSPGGTTQAGLAVLTDKARLATLFAQTLAAATARSRELAS